MCPTMARMMRRVPLPLRTWSGALLVCALLLCLASLARPAMAMPMSMPGPMGTMSSATDVGAVAERMPARAAGHAVTVSDSGERGPHCPMAEEQCASPKATVIQGSPAASGHGEVPEAVACSPAALVSQPNAPPPTLPPPDLHRLCVSRT